MHIDWPTVAAICGVVLFGWGLLKGIKHRAGIVTFFRSNRGENYAQMSKDIEDAYKTRQEQLEGEVERLTSRLSDAEKALAVLRAEVKALPAIQELSAKVENGFKSVHADLGAVLAAVGGNRSV